MTHDISQREAAAYLLRIRKASLSFPGFMDYYYPEFEWPPFMREFQDVLDCLEKDTLVTPGGNPVRQVLVTMPPRNAKSFNGTVNFPGYCMMRKPYREVMIGSYNNDMATTFGRQTREIVTSPAVRKAFPKVTLSRETRAVDFWKTTDGGAYYSIGMNGTSTGRGANLLVIDDPYKTREEAESLTVRRKVWNEYLATFRTRLQPDRDGQPAFTIVTHTRWHPDDLAGRIMETPEFKAGEWLHLNFQALSVKERGVYIRRTNLPADDPRFMPATIEREDGTKLQLGSAVGRETREVDASEEVALWPERFSVEWLKKQRAIIGDREFSALYQQQPYVVGGALIKLKWFRRYRAGEQPPFQAMAFGVDSAFKKGTRNDYSVFSMGGVTEAGDIYLLRVWRDKLEFPELKRRAVTLNATYRGDGLRGFWVEDAASGQSLIQELKKDTSVPVIPWSGGTTDKVAKANFVTPLMEGGRVFVPEEADWLEEWENEIAAFPSGKFDDQVDSFIILVDALSRMVVVGNPTWAAPIGEFIKQQQTFAGPLVFTGKPLTADPKGWQGAGGFGALPNGSVITWGG